MVTTCASRSSSGGYSGKPLDRPATSRVLYRVYTAAPSVDAPAQI